MKSRPLLKISVWLIAALLDDASLFNSIPDKPDT